MAEKEPQTELKTIDLGFIKCSICLEEMQDPKSLPCMHMFCKSCLQQYIENQQKASRIKFSAFPCPLCRKQTLPVDRTTGFHQWAEQYPSNDLVLAIENSKNLKAKDKFCNPCNIRGKEKIPAHIMCKECNVFLCNDCKPLHDIFVSGHTFCSIENLEEDPFMSISYRSKCVKHGEILSFFCVTHEQTACMLCVTLEHRLCKSIKSTKEYYDNIRKGNHVESLIENYDVAIRDMDRLIKTTTARFATLYEEKAAVEDQMEIHMAELTSHLAKIHENFLENLCKTYKEEKEKNEIKLQRCEQLKLAMEHSKRILQTALKYGSEATLLGVNTKGKKEFESYRQNVKMEYSNKEIRKLSALLSKEMKNTEKAKSFAEVTKTVDFYDQDLPLLFDWFSYSFQARMMLEFNGKATDDPTGCYFTDIIFIEQNCTVAVDHANQKLKLFSDKGRILSLLNFPHKVWGICEMKPGHLAVSGCQDKQISVVRIENNNMEIKQTITVDCHPYGIVFENEGFVVSSGDTSTKILGYSTDGTRMYSTSAMRNIYHLVKLGKSGDLVASKGENKPGDTMMAIYTGTRLQSRKTLLTSDRCDDSDDDDSGDDEYPKGSYRGGCGMTSDHQDNIYICFEASNHVAMVTKSSKSKTLLSNLNGIYRPCAIAVCENKFVLAERKHNFLKVFKMV